ncbi:m-phase inducer phosphatase 2 [Stylonychia lemnae]|uniref:protein-tyrosine-phosphatase n=1 Tax=Stylonychia lemnae TaxID=5949 RepID=A0A078ATL8_STYLE|nr:m-phase inducer phosphatase 2 [Stylonychia lemnae]|eukprot:CDW85584.1 m-phase inducer phosphatase 2 [Stylonychia lemnae]
MIVKPNEIINKKIPKQNGKKECKFDAQNFKKSNKNGIQDKLNKSHSIEFDQIRSVNHTFIHRQRQPNPFNISTNESDGLNTSGYDSIREKLKTALNIKQKNGGMSALTQNCNQDLSLMINNYESYAQRVKLRQTAINQQGIAQMKELQDKDILQVDTSSLLKSANKEMKTLLFTLNKVVNSGEEQHKEINEHQHLDIEVFEGINYSLKANIYDKNAPGLLTFQYHDSKDLIVYISRQSKEPNEENNQGKYQNEIIKELSLKPADTNQINPGAVTQQQLQVDSSQLVNGNAKQKKMALERQLRAFMTDEKSFKEFKDKIKRAKRLREQLEMQNREKNLFLIHRWEFYKVQAKEEQQKLEDYKKLVQLVVFWNKSIVADQALRNVANGIYSIREKQISKFRHHFRIKRFQRKCRHFFQKKCQNRNQRFVNTIRYTINSLAQQQKDTIETRAKQTFLDFLRVYSKKFYIKIKIKQFFERLISIQERFSLYVKQMKQRMEVLKKYFDQEQQKMILQLVKIKNKSKKQKDLLQKLREVTDSVKQAVLNKYLEKCKNENAIKFFEWRKKVMNKNLDKDQQFAMSLRMGRIKKSDQLLFQNTDETLQKELKRLEEDGKSSGQKSKKNLLKDKSEPQGIFITENEESLETLLNNAPLQFQFFPTLNLQRKFFLQKSQSLRLPDIPSQSPQFKPSIKPRLLAFTQNEFESPDCKRHLEMLRDPLNLSAIKGKFPLRKTISEENNQLIPDSNLQASSSSNNLDSSQCTINQSDSQELIIQREKSNSFLMKRKYSDIYGGDQLSQNLEDKIAELSFNSPYSLIKKQIVVKRKFKDPVCQINLQQINNDQNMQFDQQFSVVEDPSEYNSDDKDESNIDPFNLAGDEEYDIFTSQQKQVSLQNEITYKRRNLSKELNCLDYEMNLFDQSISKNIQVLDQEEDQVKIQIRPMGIDQTLYSLTQEALLLGKLSRPKYHGVNTISAETMAELILDPSKPFIIVDCRFGYEYDGGHIQGAINLSTNDQMESYFFKSQDNILKLMNSRSIIVFHCEFSQKRGPSMYKQLRKYDRKIHEMFYPEIFYTEIYLLEGGYKEFYSLHPQLCEGTYTPMKDEIHKSEGDKLFKECIINSSMKFQRNQSFCSSLFRELDL